MQKKKRLWGHILLVIYLSHCLMIPSVLTLVWLVNGRLDFSGSLLVMPILFFADILAFISTSLKIKFNNHQVGWAIFSFLFFPIGIIFEYYFWKSLTEKEIKDYEINYNFIKIIFLISLIIEILFFCWNFFFAVGLLFATKGLLWLAWFLCLINLIFFIGTIALIFLWTLFFSKFKEQPRWLIWITMFNSFNWYLGFILLDKKIKISYN